MTNELPMTVETELRDRLENEITRLMADLLPGWEKFFASNPKVKAWTDAVAAKVGVAIRDEDRARFDKDLPSVTQAWERINERLAEEYQKSVADPELWELRYIKWMKISYIKFESPLGELYMVPRRSSKRPVGVEWCTVDEMLTWLHPTVAAVINMSGKWPPRNPVLKPPALGEQLITVDATGNAVKTTFEIGKGRRYG